MQRCLRLVAVADLSMGGTLPSALMIVPYFANDTAASKLPGRSQTLLVQFSYAVESSYSNNPNRTTFQSVGLRPLVTWTGPKLGALAQSAIDIMTCVVRYDACLEPYV